MKRTTKPHIQAARLCSRTSQGCCLPSALWVKADSYNKEIKAQGTVFPPSPSWYEPGRAHRENRIGGTKKARCVSVHREAGGMSSMLENQSLRKVIRKREANGEKASCKWKQVWPNRGHWDEKPGRTQVLESWVRKPDHHQQTAMEHWDWTWCLE